MITSSRKSRQIRMAGARLDLKKSENRERACNVRSALGGGGGGLLTLVNFGTGTTAGKAALRKHPQKDHGRVLMVWNGVSSLGSSAGHRVRAGLIPRHLLESCLGDRMAASLVHHCEGLERAIDFLLDDFLEGGQVGLLGEDGQFASRTRSRRYAKSRPSIWLEQW